MSEDLIEEGYGRRIPFCRECQTAEFPDGITIVVNEKQKELSLCPHCGSRLGQRSEEFAGSSLTGKTLGDMDSIRSYAIRIFTTPWGRVKIYISRNSNFCHFAYFADADGAFTVPAVAIKRLIDESFSDEAVVKSHKELGKIDDWGYAGFVISLQSIVDAVHKNVECKVEIDLDVIASAA